MLIITNIFYADGWEHFAPLSVYLYKYHSKFPTLHMRIIRFLAPLALLLVLAGCSPYALVSSETYNDVNLRSFNTFRIVSPTDNDSTGLPPSMSTVTYYNIAAAIREQMTERGFTEDPSSPLLINIGVAIRHGVITEPLVLPVNYYPYPGPPPPPAPGVAPWFIYPRQNYWPPQYYNTGAQVVAGVYREGVLTMDMVDMARHLPVYSASVAAVMNSGNGVFYNLKEISGAVAELFSRFPIPVPKK
ncbi:MAG: DUF4136 domain-containing protein [Pseudoflavonifractor sp.]|nr:DUF4136 domain-containing protein [Alloprevotella sp.]MCM1116588.1 DUF4136 domain-containing protein [Pseudoflavonifractor sp.]